MKPNLLRLAAVVWLSTAFVCDATALDFDARLKGYLATDARFSLPGYFAKDFVADAPRFIRNETEANLRAEMKLGYHIFAVTDLTLVFTGKREAVTFEDLGDREKGDPVRIESAALYATFRDIGIEGLDFSVGRMVLPWGSADQFNPTRKLNPLDVEDPLKFGESIPNQMFVLEYAPDVTVEGEEITIFDELFFQLALVPLFRGALLPDSSLIAFENPQLSRTRFNSELMSYLFDVQEAFERQQGNLSFDVKTNVPDAHFRNLQVGARAGFTVVGIDFAVSYVHGFDDMPMPQTVYAEDVRFPPNKVNAGGGSELLEIVNGICTDGPCLQESNVHTLIGLTYPRIDQVGFELSTSLDFLGGAGLWAEVAIVNHDEQRLQVRTSSAMSYNPVSGTDYLFDVAKTDTDTEIAGGTFVKAVVGMDYSPTPWWYINAQYLHGFVDEFGASELRDFLIVGSDFNLLDQRLLIRVFGILCFDDEKRDAEQVYLDSGILYPQITYRPFAATELTLGALLYFGDEDSKFGSPLTGPSTVFLKAKYSY